MASEIGRLNASLRATGSRERAPDVRLREAIQVCTRSQMDCFVARAPRNDGETARFHGLHFESGSEEHRASNASRRMRSGEFKPIGFMDTLVHDALDGDCGGFAAADA